MGGGASSATKEQQSLTTEQTQQTMAFDQQLEGLFQKQYATQQTQLNFLQSILKPVAANAEAGNGFTKPELAAMRTSATDQISAQEQNAQKALNETLKTSGDANIPSGVTVGADEALANQAFQAKAGAQNNITVQNAEQANSNLFNAVSALNGVATEESPTSLESGSLEGGSTVAGLSSAQGGLQNSITNANSNSFFGKLGSGFASGLGGGLAGALTGGVGMALPFANPF
jgi:hypothetical protein